MTSAEAVTTDERIGPLLRAHFLNGIVPHVGKSKFNKQLHCEAEGKQYIIYNLPFRQALECVIATISCSDIESLELFFKRLKRKGTDVLFSLRGSITQRLKTGNEQSSSPTLFLEKLKKATTNQSQYPEWKNIFEKMNTVDIDILINLHKDENLEMVKCAMGFDKSTCIEINGTTFQWESRTVTGTIIQHAVVRCTLSSGNTFLIDILPFPYDNVLDGRAGITSTARDLYTLPVKINERGELEVEVSAASQMGNAFPNGPRILPETAKQQGVSPSDYIACMLRSLVQNVLSPPIHHVEDSWLGIPRFSFMGDRRKKNPYSTADLIFDFKRDDKVTLTNRTSQITKDMAVLLYMLTSRDTLTYYLSKFLAFLVTTDLIYYFPSMLSRVDRNILFNIQILRKAVKANSVEQMSVVKDKCEFLKDLLNKVEQGTADIFELAHYRFLGSYKQHEILEVAIIDLMDELSREATKQLSADIAFLVTTIGLYHDMFDISDPDGREGEFMNLCMPRTNSTPIVPNNETAGQPPTTSFSKKMFERLLSTFRLEMK